MLYDIHGKVVKEAEVVRCRNGAAVNYPEDYMRRRDPDCMRIADTTCPQISPASRRSTAIKFDELRIETAPLADEAGAHPGPLQGRRL